MTLEDLTVGWSLGLGRYQCRLRRARPLCCSRRLVLSVFLVVETGLLCVSALEALGAAFAGVEPAVDFGLADVVGADFEVDAADLDAVEPVDFFAEPLVFLTVSSAELE